MYVMYCESLMFPERSSLSRVVHRYGERFVHLETFRSLQSRFCASTAAIFRFSTSYDIVTRTPVLLEIRPTKRDLSYDLFALISTRQRYFCARRRDDAWTRFLGRVEYRGSCCRSAKPRGNCVRVRPSYSLARKTFERSSAASMFSR